MAIRDLYYDFDARLYAATDDAIVVWDTETNARVTAEDIPVTAADGIWSDTSTLWYTRSNSPIVAAVTLSSKTPDATKNFSVENIVDVPAGMDQAGGTLWVANKKRPPSQNTVVGFNFTTKAVKTDSTYGGNLSLVLNTPVASVFGHDVPSENLHIIYPIYGDITRSQTFLYAWRAGSNGNEIYYDAAHNIYLRDLNGNRFTGDFHIRAMAGIIEETVYVSTWEEPNRIMTFQGAPDPDGRGYILRQQLALPVDPSTPASAIVPPAAPTVVSADIGAALAKKSYVTLEEGLEIALCYAAEPPDGASFASALLRAMPYIDQTHRDQFVGVKTSDTQVNQWPRKDTSDDSKVTISSGEEFPSNVVPMGIKHAQVFTAIRLLQNLNPFESRTHTATTTVTPGGELIEETYGPVTFKYSAGSTNTRETDRTLPQPEHERAHEISLNDILRAFLTPEAIQSLLQGKARVVSNLTNRPTQ